MAERVIIIGAGMGGLTAAIRLAQRGCDVSVLEARQSPGWLASGFESHGLRFDAGPYVLLDRPGLEWAFAQLNSDLAQQVPMQRIDHVYQVTHDDQPPVSVFDSLDQTAAEFDARWPGAGARYRRFVDWTTETYRRLQPLQWRSHPGLGDLLRTGAWRDVPFVLRSLGSVLRSSRLPREVRDTLGIWTHVAGQLADRAPSPLALVTSVVHRVGACYPEGGVARIPETLFQIARDAQVKFHFGSRVDAIACDAGRIKGVRVEGEFLPADAVLSNVGLGTYTRLLDDEGRAAVGARAIHRLERLPLQSPGVAAYLAVRGQPRPPYLRFRLRNEQDGCRLLVTPAVIEPTHHEGWYPARLVAPMGHARAMNGGEAEQSAFRDQVLEEDWWRSEFDEVRILETRIPREWGERFALDRDSMNPVMTARFMLTGRIPHRSRRIRGLYLAGSATHPGQWVSFCAVSGILAADRLLADRRAGS